MNKVVNFSLFSNPEYKPGNILKRIVWIVMSRIFINTNLPYPQIFKMLVLRLFGAKLGVGIVIKPKVNIKYPWFLKIGDYSWIGEKVWIDNLGTVTIGSNVCMSQGSMLLCGNHNYKKSTFDLIVGNITLEDGVWIGAKSVVCPGVTCKTHSILSVNSVATKDLETYCIYVGNPAIKVRERIINK